MLLTSLLLSAKLTHVLLLGERLECIVGLLGHRRVGHEWVLLHLLHVGEGVLPSHLLLQHHVGLELLLHARSHHLHHLVLLVHVGLLLVAHRVRNETRWLLKLLLLLRGSLVVESKRVAALSCG